MKILTVVQITAVYMWVYLILLLVLPQLLITVLRRNDNSSLGFWIMETRPVGFHSWWWHLHRRQRVLLTNEACLFLKPTTKSNKHIGVKIILLSL